MAFREILIGAAAIELFSPGSLKRVAEAALSTCAMAARNMPAAAQLPQQAVIYNAPQSEPKYEAKFEICAACGKERVWLGRCIDCNPSVKRSGPKRPIKSAGTSRSLLLAPHHVDEQPKEAKRNNVLPKSSRAGRKKDNPNKRTKAIWKRRRVLSADPEKTCQEIIDILAKEFRTEDQSMKGARRSVRLALSKHSKCEGCSDCMSTLSE